MNEVWDVWVGKCSRGETSEINVNEVYVIRRKETSLNIFFKSPFDFSHLSLIRKLCYTNMIFTFYSLFGPSKQGTGRF